MSIDGVASAAVAHVEFVVGNILEVVCAPSASSVMTHCLWIAGRRETRNIELQRSRSGRLVYRLGKSLGDQLGSAHLCRVPTKLGSGLAAGSLDGGSRAIVWASLRSA